MIPDSIRKIKKMNDSYTFSTSIKYLVEKALKKKYKDGNKKRYRITRKQFVRSILRTQLVHNVNFKGQIEPYLTPFDISIEAKRNAIKKIMED